MLLRSCYRFARSLVAVHARCALHPGRALTSPRPHWQSADDAANAMSDVSLSEPPSPSTTAPAPAPPRPPLPSAPPPVAAAASDSPAPVGGVGAPAHAAKELTAEQRADLAQLTQMRSALKLQEMKQKDVIEADKVTEDKIAAAITGRTAVALQGAKDLSAFVSAVTHMEEGCVKATTRIAGLFAQETSVTAEAVAPFLASCKELEALHTDLQKVLSAVEMKRATDTSSATKEACDKLNLSCNRMTSDLASARRKLQGAMDAQAKAWESCDEAAAARATGGVRRITHDPWLASLEYETANRGLASVQAEHAGGFHGFVGDLRDMDRSRLQVLKHA